MQEENKAPDHNHGRQHELAQRKLKGETSEVDDRETGRLPSVGAGRFTASAVWFRVLLPVVRTIGFPRRVTMDGV